MKGKDIALLGGAALVAYLYFSKNKTAESGGGFLSGGLLPAGTNPVADIVSTAGKILGDITKTDVVSQAGNMVKAASNTFDLSSAVLQSSPSVQTQLGNIAWLNAQFGSQQIASSFTPQGALYVRPTAAAGTAAFTTQQQAIDSATRATIAAVPETYGYTPYSGGAVVLNIAQNASGSYAPTAGAQVVQKSNTIQTAAPAPSVLPTSDIASRIARGLM